MIARDSRGTANVMSSHEPVPDSPPTGAPAGARGPGRLLVACGALLAVAWIGWMSRLHAGHWVDDAYIGFRYAEHLRAGLTRQR